MKQKDLTVTVNSGEENELQLQLQAPEPETLDEYVELCGGDVNAAIKAAMAGWYVKAQSKIRNDVGKALESEEPPKDPLSYAQDILNDFTYTGPRERKAKKKVKISQAALKEKGIKAGELKQMDKLLELLRQEGVEVEV